jgi:hypothetical protein
MIRKEAESEIGKVSVSDNADSRRVDDMSHDVEAVLSETQKKMLTLLYRSTSQQT